MSSERLLHEVEDLRFERICAFDCMDIAEIVERQKLSTDCCAFADRFLLQVSRSMIYENVDSLQTLLEFMSFSRFIDFSGKCFAVINGKFIRRH